MKAVLSILILLSGIRTLSFGIWCIKYDKKNILGSISVIILTVLLFILSFLSTKIHG